MSVRRSDDFIADVERQYEWYGVHAGWDVADHYLAAVKATCQLLEQHPLIGPRGPFTLRAFAIGISSSSSVHSKSTFSSMKCSVTMW